VLFAIAVVLVMIAIAYPLVIPLFY
jgi:hypothetical protein